MHSSSCDLEPPRLGGAEVFVAIAALVTEGRTPSSKTPSTAAPEKPGAPAKHRTSGTGFSEGPHCTFSKASQGHVCNLDNLLCIKYDKIRSYVLSLWQKSLPLCIDVLLVPNCCCENDLVCNPSTSQEPIGFAMLLEQWNINVLQRRTHDFSPNLNINQLISAIRSQLYFSQISAWLASPDEKIRSSFQDKSIVYCLTVPGETFGCKTFASNAQHHNFPTADLGNGVVVKVSLSNVPRTEEIPHIKCSKCDVPNASHESHNGHNTHNSHNGHNNHNAISVLDDRMQMSCTLKGKHRCDDYEDFENNCTQRFKQRNYLHLDTNNKSMSSNSECCTTSSASTSTSTSRGLFSNLSNLMDGATSTATTATTSSTNSHQHQHQGTSKSNNKCDMKCNDVPLSVPVPVPVPISVPVIVPVPIKGGKCEKNEHGSPKVDLELSRKEFVEVLSVLRQSVPMKSQNTKKHDLANANANAKIKTKANTNTNTITNTNTNKNQGDILLDAILRSSKVQSEDEATTVVMAAKMDMTNDALICGDHGGKNPPSPGSLSLERHKRKGAAFLKSLYPDVRVDGGCGGGGIGMRVGDNMCDNKNDSIISDNRSLGGNDNIYIDINCDNIKRKKTTDYIKMCDISNVFSLEYLQKRQKVKVKQKITFDDNNHYNHNHQQQQQQQQQQLDLKTKYDKCNKQEEVENNCQVDRDENRDSDRSDTCLNVKDAHTTNAGVIPSALEQAKFRKSLDNAASMVFHSRTGLPLTSSPAPVRRGKSCFDFDSSINSVSAIRSALFSLASCSTDEDSESDCSIVSPCSPETTNGLKQREIPLINYRHRGQSSGLLGSFVESVLNGRLEPVSTVHGFSAELGASGSFCPRHVVLPVTVFFYTLGDNDKVSTPYLGHINLGKKGYNVPKSGTIQVTLFNPLGTVVKMFVIMYDLSDMPPNSQTFIRQRTLFMPANCEDKNLEWSQKWLRYLIHLRFMSSKSGRIYLHSDIRMIICRKSDLDTATAHGIDMSYELRSFINIPTNPRFSPRK